MTLAALSLIIVCQGYPGCGPQGTPLLGAIADGYTSCEQVYLPNGASWPCRFLGGVIPFGDLFEFPDVAPGEVAALIFEEAP